MLPSGSPRAVNSHVRPDRVLAVRSDACDLNDEQVSTLIRQHMGWEAGQVTTACIDNEQVGIELAAGLRTKLDAVVVVTPATQNPIIAIASFLRELTAMVRPGGEVIVLLTGEAAAPDSSWMAERHQIWSRFAAINRLGVGVERCR